MSISSHKRLPIRYIEFTGPSGAGKSTIAKILVEQLRQMGYFTVFRGLFVPRETPRLVRITKGVMLLRYVDVCTVRMVWHYIFSVRNPQQVLKKSISNAGDYLIIKHFLHLQKVQPSAIVIFEEGLLKNMARALRRESDDVAIIQECIRGIFQQPALVVYVDTPVDVAVARATSRPYPNPYLVGLLPTDMARQSEYKRMYNGVLEYVETLGATTLMLDGTCSPEENAGRVLREIETSWQR